MDGAGLTYYAVQTATGDGDSKSPSTSGLGATKSEHLSLQLQPQLTQFSDVALEPASEATADPLFFTSSYNASNNYVVSVRPGIQTKGNLHLL